MLTANFFNVVFYFGLWNALFYITPHFIEKKCPFGSKNYHKKQSIHMYTIKKFKQNGKHSHTVVYDIFKILPGFDASNLPVWLLFATGNDNYPIICTNELAAMQNMNNLLVEL